MKFGHHPNGSTWPISHRLARSSPCGLIFDHQPSLEYHTTRNCQRLQRTLTQTHTIKHNMTMNDEPIAPWAKPAPPIQHKQEEANSRTIRIPKEITQSDVAEICLQGIYALAQDALCNLADYKPNEALAIFKEGMDRGFGKAAQSVNVSSDAADRNSYVYIELSEKTALEDHIKSIVEDAD